MSPNVQCEFDGSKNNVSIKENKRCSLNGATQIIAISIIIQGANIYLQEAHRGQSRKKRTITRNEQATAQSAHKSPRANAMIH